MPNPQTADVALAFEPIELNDKLAFLACYSRYVIALQAESPHNLAQELADTCEEICPVLLISGDKLASNPASLYETLATGFGLASSHGEKALVELVRSVPVRPLVIVSRAEQLEQRQLTLISGIAAQTGLGLLLLSRNSLQRKMSAFSDNVLHTTVNKLNARDVKQLLHRRVNPSLKVSELDIHRVLNESRGDLQRADSLVQDLIVSERRHLGLPLVHMSMLILFVGLVIGGFLLIPGGETEVKPIALSPKPVPEPMAQVSSRGQDEPPLKNAGQYDESPAEERPVSQVKVSASPTTEPDDRDELAGAQTPRDSIKPGIAEPIVLDSADPNAWINNLPATAAGSREESSPTQGVNQADWLLTATDTAYTLQILGSFDESRILAFMDANPGYGDYGYFETRHLNQPWFVLTYGRYMDREAALRAIQELPFALKAQKPWARGVKTIRGG